MTRTHQERLAHMERLQARRREALRLREDEGKTVQEVATLLKISKTLASRIIQEAREERDHG